ncbi:hypothetical protein Pcinc_032861 [Petrolisthes cinctipes]|uniref:Uncharacterized protein n=1 Tax=Petrolisthes cinctipes TaxID=88211 RepID=A0AAE1JZY8_PETCI|nr:hypothetical protein Pcinc_032861 [Petrolisthes cinctipes]
MMRLKSESRKLSFLRCVPEVQQVSDEMTSCARCGNDKGIRSVVDKLHLPSLAIESSALTMKLGVDVEKGVRES